MRLQKIKIPQFILGMVTGILLSVVLGAGGYHYLYFSIADGIVESPVIPFYVLEDDPNYDVYRQLENPEYWRLLSESAQAEAEKYCRQNNIAADITVRCSGSPQAYEIYYSMGRYTSLRDLLNRDKVEIVIVECIDSNYQSLLRSIIKWE